VVTQVATGTRRAALVRRALGLAVLTVCWNVVEGVVALAAGAAAGSRALAGFGVDSFVESLSAGVLIWRLRVEQQDPERVEQVERQAVRLIGVAFLALAALVGVESVRSLLAGDRADTSPIGIGLTSVSLVVMPILARAKRRVGAEMGDRSVEADSRQTWACVALSFVVLGGLLVNQVLGWWWADPVAALVVVGFLVREGRGALRAEHVDDCC
jgi:divalent metal cation (Fe/Co/Zn/Cd) transporter